MAQQKHRGRRKPPSKSKPVMPSVVQANRETENAAQPWEEPPREAGRPRGEGQSIQVDDPERLHFDASHTLLGEIDTLIEQYGEDAPAIDFVIAKASEPLSRVIEALMNDANSTQRPTLAAVQAAITHGAIARLVGEGAIDPDDEAGLLDEIQYMIQQFGPAALAEHFIRYE